MNIFAYIRAQLKKLRDADFCDLPWEGWDEIGNRAIGTTAMDCEDAVYILTQKGWLITGVNRSARILHVSSAAHIAVCLADSYNSRRPESDRPKPQMRIYRYGKVH